MTRAPSFPVYVVRIPPIQEGCGHQHASHGSAHNCAINIMQKRPNLSHANVVMIRQHASKRDVKTAIMETIDRTQVLTTNKR